MREQRLTGRYGEAPVAIRGLALDWTEFMHYLYLPVKLPYPERQAIHGAFRLPERLGFLAELVETAWRDWCTTQVHACDPADAYVYVTARRGFATPDNPLNRPGWHCDGFGTDDVNYVWWDRWSTRFAVGDFGHVPADHVESMVHFDALCGRKPFTDPVPGLSVETRDDGELYRLSPFVVHSTPELAEAGMRSFVKVSISRHRYNLVGNSHNYLFDYDWKMHPRDALRNDPARGMADFYEEKPNGS